MKHTAPKISLNLLTEGEDMKTRIVMAAAMATAVMVSGVTVARGQVQLDPALQPYKTVSGVSGNLTSVGSDTLNNLMTFWAERFKKSTRTSRSRSRARAPRPRLRR